MIDRILESLDLSALHTFLTLAGMLLAIFVMQQTGHLEEDRDDPGYVRWGNRLALGGIAMALLWSLSYSQTKHWQPWPPELALIAAVILVLSFRAIAVHFHLKRQSRARHPVGAAGAKVLRRN